MKVYLVKFDDKSKCRVVVSKKADVETVVAEELAMIKSTKKIVSIEYWGVESELKGQATYRLSKGLFRHFQPNSKDIKDEFGDCIFRALCGATGKTWLEVFDELLPIARELQCPMNWDTCYEKFLETNGFKYHSLNIKRGDKRPTVASFTETHKQGRYFLHIAHHAVASVNGRYYDTWDSGTKALYGYWEK